MINCSCIILLKIFGLFTAVKCYCNRSIERANHEGDIIIARAILERPQLLVLDEAFTGLDQASKLTILDNLFDQENAWTIVDISHDIHMVLRTQTVHVIQDHHIVETGNIADLTKNKQSAFAELFPSLSKLTNLLNKAKEE